MKLFPLNLALKCEVVLNSRTKCQSGPHKPDCSEQDHEEPNHCLHHQIMCSSGILHGAESKFLTNILGPPIDPIFKHRKIQKREHSMTDVDTIFFGGGTLSIV
jgi:hypothetical protein